MDVEGELEAIAAGLKDAGKGIIQMVMDFPDEHYDGISLLRRLAEQSGRPATFTMGSGNSGPEGWREGLQKVEAANPAPKGSEVLLRVTAAGVCHSDVHLWEGYFDMGGGNKYSTEKTMAPPRTMGHEIVGVVEALGPEATGAKVGDKAVVYPWIGCGKCWYCQNGTENLCPTPHALGVNEDGGYADHMIVPHPKYLYSYGSLPVELACLYSCSGITAFGAVKKAVGGSGRSSRASRSTSSAARSAATAGWRVFQRSSPASASSFFCDCATTTSGIFCRGAFGVADLLRDGATRGASPSVFL